jgi:hypothetical protein
VTSVDILALKLVTQKIRSSTYSANIIVINKVISVKTDFFENLFGIRFWVMSTAIEDQNIYSMDIWKR